MTLLRACPNLERLALDHALSHITGVPDHPQATSALVTLPRLRTLSLHHPLDLNARILACLTTPAVSRVELSDNTSDTDHDNVLNRSHTFAAILPPNRAAILPAALISRIVSVVFTSEKQDHLVSCDDGQDETVLDLRLTADDDVGSWYNDLTHVGARDIATILVGASVLRLDLSIDFECINRDGLASMFRGMGQLQSLKLGGRGDFDKTFEVLTPGEDGSESEAEERSDRPQVLEVLCPQLRSIPVCHFWNHSLGNAPLFETILEMLRAREAYGTARLDSLSIELMQETEDEYRELHDKYVPQLQQLVEEVEYEHEDYVEYDPEFDWGI